MYFQNPKLALWLSCVWALTAHVHAHAHEGHEACGDQGHSAASAQVQYHSPIQTYQHYRPTNVQPWSASNQTVQDVGGWRAYAKEAGGQP
jgi:hypothetical protein